MRRKVVHSLRARLLLLLFAAVMVTACIQSFIAYRTSLDETNEIFDYQMQQMALSLRPGLPFGGYGSNGFRSGEKENFDFIVQVSASDNRVLFRSSESITLPQREGTGFSLFDSHGTTYKLYSLRYGVQLIQVAQDRAARRSLAERLAFRITLPVLVMVTVLFAMVWWVVTFSLAPLNRVQRQISMRKADSLDEVDTNGLPTEVCPLVLELNLLLRRVQQAFDTQKDFVADAAHELRSPLAALNLQMELLRRTDNEHERDIAIQRMGSGIDRAARLVEQLMVLARQQTQSASSNHSKPVEVNRLCLFVFNEVFPQAQQKHIDIVLSQTDECYVLGQEEAIRIMLRNILDNAIKHSPAYSKVNFKAALSGRTVSILVEDSGPGISEKYLDRVVDRFYRIPGNSTPGSGLGLTIVKTIADSHMAKLKIEHSARLGGLAVKVVFEAYRLLSVAPNLHGNSAVWL